MAKKLKVKRKSRADLVKAIRLTWSSLDSHLEPSLAPEAKRCCAESCGLPPFHARCVREYAFIIKVLSDYL